MLTGWDVYVHCQGTESDWTVANEPECKQCKSAVVHPNPRRSEGGLGLPK